MNNWWTVSGETCVPYTKSQCRGRFPRWDACSHRDHQTTRSLSPLPRPPICELWESCLPKVKSIHIQRNAKVLKDDVVCLYYWGFQSDSVNISNSIWTLKLPCRYFFIQTAWKYFVSNFHTVHNMQESMGSGTDPLYRFAKNQSDFHIFLCICVKLIKYVIGTKGVWWKW